jgi:hypothetical protein
MASNLKKMVLGRMEKTGESWQAALRNVRSHADRGQDSPQPTEGRAPELLRPLDALLRELHTPDTFPVIVGRVTPFGSADPQEARRQSQHLASNPMYYAETGSIQMVISRDQLDLLVANGAAEDFHVQMFRSCPPVGGVTFADQCKSCSRWIWFGFEPHAGKCVCGQQYQVAFDAQEHERWSMHRGARCVDCGTEDGMALVSEGRSPWTVLNVGQTRCHRCQSSPAVSPSDSTDRRMRKTPDTILAWDCPQCGYLAAHTDLQDATQMGPSHSCPKGGTMRSRQVSVYIDASGERCVRQANGRFWRVNDP